MCYNPPLTSFNTTTTWTICSPLTKEMIVAKLLEAKSITVDEAVILLKQTETIIYKELPQGNIQTVQPTNHFPSPWDYPYGEIRYFTNPNFKTPLTYTYGVTEAE